MTRRRPSRPGSAALKVWAGGLCGAVLGIWVAASVPAPLGPFNATVTVRPATSGETTVLLGPLGSIRLDTHDAPLAVQLRVDELRFVEAERIADDPAVLEAIGDDVVADARRALLTVAVRTLLAAVLGGILGALVGSATLAAARRGAGVGTVVVGLLALSTYLSFDPAAVGEPRYRGLVRVAPTAVGDVRALVDRFGQYRAQVADLVTNVVTLYRAAEGLPTFRADDDTVTVLHVSDVHLNPQAFDLIELLVTEFGAQAVLDTGDITDWGSEPETRLLDRIADLDVPYVWVRGNHDSRTTQQAVAGQPNAVVLDGKPKDVVGLRLWGIGDPRYTPDKRPKGRGSEREQIERFAQTVPGRIAPALPVDVVLVHDPRAAAELDGTVPLVLAGHTHEADERTDGGTLVLVEGSTGGAGLRGLQGETPRPLTATLLHFDRASRRLLAYDRVTVRGLGETGAQVQRHLAPGADDAAGDEPSARSAGRPGDVQGAR